VSSEALNYDNDVSSLSTSSAVGLRVVRYPRRVLTDDVEALWDTDITYHGQVWGNFSRGKQRRLRELCGWFVALPNVSI
jgi:hypothetical protein